ncbi:ABC transporter ATP-binding protein [Microlunatus sp. GCM10028923]
MIVVQDVDLKVSPGSTLGILGANGSGKTTVLHMVSGLLAATSGSVHYCGVSVSDKRSRSFYGLAPDDLPLPTALTGREYLQMVARLRDVADASIAVGNLIEAFALGSHLGSLVGTYSHGMKRKLQLIAALAHAPKVLILDEPFRGLDPPSSELLADLIRDFTHCGGAVIIATHDLGRAEQHCTDVLILSQGMTVAQGASVT